MPKEYTRPYLEEHALKLGIPSRMHDGLFEYILEGRPTGHFLAAVISNDLKEAVGRADEENQKLLTQYVMFLYNHAPMGCWGSEEKYHTWIGHKGLRFVDPGKNDYAYPDGHGPDNYEPPTGS